MNNKSKADIFLDKMAAISVGMPMFSEETQEALLYRVIGPVTILDLFMAWVLFVMMLITKGL